MFLDYIELFLCGKHTEKFFEKLAAHKQPKTAVNGTKMFFSGANCLVLPGNFLIKYFLVPEKDQSEVKSCSTWL